MRIFIPFLCLMLFVACHNKSDLKRIAELEKENDRLSDLLKKQYQIQIDAEYKLLYGDEFPICDLSIPGAIAMHYVKNEQTPQRLYVNRTLTNQIRFYEDLSWKIDTIRYSTPSKDKLNLKKYTNKIVNNSDRYIYNFNYTPMDTGYYYFDGEMITINHRTGRLNKIYFTDSFYVYK